MKISVKDRGRFTIMLVALSALLIPIGLYYLIRIPNQEEYFSRQYLRLLGDMSVQISEKVSNYETILRNASVNLPERSLNDWYGEIRDVYQINLDNRSGVTSDSVLVRLTTLPANREYAERLVKPWLEGRIETALELVEDLEFVAAHVKLGRRNVIESGYEDKFWEFDAAIDQMDRIDSFSRRQLEMKRESGVYWLHIYYEVYQRKYEYTTRIHARVRFEELVTPILTRSLFDDVLLLDTHGEVRFQQHPRELHTVRLDTLKGAENTAITRASMIGVSQVADVVLGGTDYKLFIQPIKFPSIRLDDAGDDLQADWLLGGLMLRSRFNSQSRSISISWIVAFSLVALLVLISLPLFKLWYMGYQDLLKKRDVVLLLMSMVVGTGLVVLILLDVTYYQELKYEMRKKLETLANTIEQSFKSELRAVDAQLDAFIEVAGANPNIDVRSNVDTSLIPHIYPYFTDLSSIDAHGRQRIKWSRRDRPTPLIDVGRRAYYQQARQGRLWTPDPSKPELRLFIEPIYSWNTGQNQVIVSKPASDSTVVTLSTRLLSRMNPVLPPTIGYAVVDEDGSVLFHQDEGRNLRENFFAESDENDEVLNAVRMRVSTALDASYQGKDHRFYVRPVEGTPWVLVLFQDKHVLRTANLQTIAEAGMLFVIYLLISAVLFLGWMLWIWVRHDRKVSYGWAWPSSRRAKAYNQIIKGNVVLAVTMTAVILLSHPYQLLHVMVLMPVLAGLLAFLNMKEAWHTVDVPKPVVEHGPGWWVIPAYRLKTYLPAAVILVVLWLISIIALEPHQAGDYLTLLVLMVGTGAAFLFISFSGVLSGTPATSKETHRSKNSVDFRRSYLIAIFSLVVVGSIIPVVGMFKIAYDTENALRVRQRLFKLGEALQVHCERLDIVCVNGSEDVKNTAKWSIHIAGFAEADADTSDVVKSSTWPDWIRALYVSVRPRFNNLTYETNAIVRRTDDERVFTKTEGGIQMAARPGLSPITLSASVPAFKSVFVLEGPSKWIWLLGMPAILAVLFVLIKTIANQVVLLPLEEPTNVDVRHIIYGAKNTNFFIVGTPNSGKSALFERNSRIQYHNLRNVENAEDLRNLKPKHGTLRWVLDHFEHNANDPDWTAAKTELVRRMIDTPSTPVAVISTEPVVENEWSDLFSGFVHYHMHGQSDPKAFEEKLEKILPRVEKENPADVLLQTRVRLLCQFLRTESAPLNLRKVGEDILEFDDRIEEQSHEELRSLFLEWARQDYRLIWTTCSEPQKMVLNQLAKEGFVNFNAYKSTILRELMRKGLIRFAPELRLMNVTFRDYLLQPAIQDEVDDLIEQHGASTWQKMKVPLLTVLVGVSLFIFITQQEVFNVTLAWVSAVATALPAMFKVFSVVGRGNAGAETDN